MATDSSLKTKKSKRDPWRSIYRFSAEQVWKMIDHGILPEGGNIELWDGILYKMTKGELHNLITTGIADAMRQVAPNGYHVREEKSCSYADNSLPEPDVAICRGNFRSYYPNPPSLAHLVLVVEIDYSTKAADQDKRHHRYAEVGIPIYWQVSASEQVISVYQAPEGTGATSSYKVRDTYDLTQEMPIVIDGREVGRAAVADFFPIDPSEARP